MDTILHSVQGGLMTSYATDNLYIIAGGALIGALPDLIGYAEKLVYKNDSWKWYNKVHKLKWSNPMAYLPQSLLHIFLDSFVHTDKCKWWEKNCIKWEILAWVTTLLYFISTFVLDF